MLPHIQQLRRNVIEAEGTYTLAAKIFFGAAAFVLACIFIAVIERN